MFADQLCVVRLRISYRQISISMKHPNYQMNNQVADLISFNPLQNKMNYTIML